MGEFLDFPTLIVIIVAIVVLLRLRSVLGTRTGNERPPSQRYESVSRTRPDNDENVVQMPRRGQVDNAEAERAQRKLEAEIEKFSAGKPEVEAGLRAIADVDPAFSPKQFLEGAKAAYEMIVTAYAAGDRKALKGLLDKDVYDSFDAAITEREAAGHSTEFTFVGLSNIEYVEAELDKRNAVVTLKIDAEVVSITKDREGEIVEGTPGQVVAIADEWTFMRNTKSRDPNWKLVATNDLE
ncbi:Tim44/TimA family putative adaptor protein [Pelagibacterium luteolum]|uniref:Predicted lipid-binding transport protein, Tim44 family n=1 Tax=Pelagibacterium luteolum TaxID=440168 RepID=A0A1G7SI11_9HYPH|nr:Tim44/TimA family putative adaptor protein [Pelagibacterium luteolum]SDG22643.1 Predicted lipid-binding transport protein, Tim44 family [Pelagibacterium luteolum]